MNSALPLFVSECTEKLDSLEALLLTLEQGKADREVLNAMFRDVHTIKGNASVIQHGEIEWFAHVVESVLDRLRAGEITADRQLVSCLLPCVDHLRFLVGTSALPEPREAGFADEERARLIGLLVPYLNEKPQGFDGRDPREYGADSWTIQVRFVQNVLQRGLDPVYFLRHLESIGKIVNLTVLSDSLPSLEDYKPELCYLGFEIELDTVADKQAIEDVFAFVSDDCELRIRPPVGKLQEFICRIRSLPAEDLHIGEMLVRVGALTADELANGLRNQRRLDLADGNEREIGNLLVEEGFLDAELLEAVLQRQYEIRQSQAQEHRLLRVPAEGICELEETIALVLLGFERLARECPAGGEGLMSRQIPVMQAQLARAAEICRQIQRVRLEEVFRRLHRLARDTSQSLGKQADLLVSGGELEVERELAEGLAEPLIHLVRNALDHGIELPATRLAEGKSARGQVRIDAWEERDSLVLLVSDDGAGIDRDRIVQTARERGFAPPLEDEALLALLFAPGFSTARCVSRISGRGVGLDVVKTSIEAFGGSIRVRSFPARGTRFELHLPRRFLRETSAT